MVSPRGKKHIVYLLVRLVTYKSTAPSYLVGQLGDPSSGLVTTRDGHNDRDDHNLNR